nr:ras suppressor protein 1 isoform X2 [Loxodonta africana]
MDLIGRPRGTHSIRGGAPPWSHVSEPVLLIWEGSGAGGAWSEELPRVRLRQALGTGRVPGSGFKFCPERAHLLPPECVSRKPVVPTFPSCLVLPFATMSKSLKKLVEESREKNQPEVDMSDRGISNMLDVNGLSVPPNIAELKNLEVLNFFNNQIEELPTQISSLQKLKHLNLGMNRLNTLPRGFGSLPALEVLDLTYNNLNENSLPGNFFYLTTLRALYLSDNDFEILPPDIGKLTKLQILSLRDNDLISLPKEIGELTQLKELHIQGNRLTVLPPELGNLDLTGQKQVFKAENNPWVTPIADQFQLGVSHVFEYIRSETYKYLYGRHMQANPEPPKKNNDKSKKISRKPLTAKNR